MNKHTDGEAAAASKQTNKPSHKNNETLRILSFLLFHKMLVIVLRIKSP